MTSYHIAWYIDVEADTPEEAARKALAIQRNPASTATVFNVTAEDGEMEDIDLTELDEAA